MLESDTDRMKLMSNPSCRISPKNPLKHYRNPNMIHMIFILLENTNWNSKIRLESSNQFNFQWVRFQFQNWSNSYCDDFHLEELGLEPGERTADPQVNFLTGVDAFRFVFVRENQRVHRHFDILLGDSRKLGSKYCLYYSKPNNQYSFQIASLFIWL